MATEQQMISNYHSVLEALKLIASGGIGAAIAGSIGKLIVDRKLARQQANYDRQLEALKSQLEKKKTIHKLQFEKEFELYDNLWKALMEVRSYATITPSLDFLPRGKDFKQVYEERLNKAFEAVQKALNVLILNRPFFHHDVSNVAEKLLRECSSHVHRTARKLTENKIETGDYDKADALWETMNQAIDEIEKVIKTRIGLLQDAELVE